MSAQSTPILTLTCKATGIIAAHRFVTPLIAQAAANVNALGVSRVAAAVGDNLPVDVLGTTVVESGAAFAAGDTLEIDADGKAVVWATAGAKVAIALQASGAAGQLVEVLLIPNAA